MKLVVCSCLMAAAAVSVSKEETPGASPEVTLFAQGICKFSGKPVSEIKRMEDMG